VALLAIMTGMLLGVGGGGEALAGSWRFFGGCGDLTEIEDFGSNPGDLSMCAYLPEGLGNSRPLVVALHGCTQGASDYGDETGWKQLADAHGFALLLPQQSWSNNIALCFNWFRPQDISRGDGDGGGEAASIRQMIETMKGEYAIDSNRIYITGLSAGGAMTAAMLSLYPEVFAGGAVIAGVPFGCATDLGEAQDCMDPGRDLSPLQWGNLVRDARGTAPGKWPIVSIWHGDADDTVNIMNAGELVDQWTDVHGIDREPDRQSTVNGHTRRVYVDDAGTARVEIYVITDMAHGTPVDPGGASGEPCGVAGSYILDARICSSRNIARFWGLIEP
jgi:poly(hydroxyalkanoate) depolymerase family esterase